MYADAFLPEVRGRINQQTADPGRRAQLRKFASTTINLCRAFTDAVASVYSHGVRRYLADVPEAQADAFAVLVEESRAALEQEAWAHDAWLAGPVFVVPVVDEETSELRLDVATPDCTDWRRRTGGDLSELLVRNDEDGVWVVADTRGFFYFDERGKLVGQQAHGLGYVPSAEFRSTPTLRGEAATVAGEGLVDATLDAAVVYAHMTWLRRVQAGFLTSIAGDDLGTKMPSGQSISEPERPIPYEGDAGTFRVDVQNRDAPIDPFIKHLSTIVTQQAVTYGIPPSEVHFETNAGQWGAYSIAVRPEKLGHLRRKQVPFALYGERRLWNVAAAVVRSSRHRLARAMPDAETMRAALRTEFPSLDFQADPLKRMSLFKEEMSIGAASPLDYLQSKDPMLTREQARRRQAENIEDHAETLRVLIAHNIPAQMSAEGQVQTAAQINGAAGGRARAQNQETDGERTAATA